MKESNDEGLGVRLELTILSENMAPRCGPKRIGKSNQT